MGNWGSEFASGTGRGGAGGGRLTRSDGRREGSRGLKMSDSGTKFFSNNRKACKILNHWTSSESNFNSVLFAQG